MAKLMQELNRLGRDELMKIIVRRVKRHGGLDNDTLKDAGRHGADAGWGGFTYTTDCVKFYDRNEELIWELLARTAEDMGESPLALVITFRRGDMADSLDGFKNLLAWFTLEEAGRYLSDREE